MSSNETFKEIADLKVTLSDLTAARKSLAIQVPADQVSREYEKACRKYVRNLRLPGFRQGKVPLHIIRQRFGREIEQETVEHVIEHALEKTIAGAELKPLRNPVLKEYTYKHGEPLSFTAEVEVRPKVTARGLDRISVRIGQPAVTDKMVSDALESLRDRAARFDPVQGRGVRPGDFVLMDLKVRIAEGGDRALSKADALIEIGSGGPYPELTDHLREMRPGEAREFSITHPGEIAGDELAGRPLAYTVLLHEIKQKNLPDLDDEFARDLGKFENLEELRRGVEQDLMEKARRRAREEARGAAIEQLLENNPGIEVPDVLVDEEVNRRIDDLARSMLLQGMDPRRAEVDWGEIREKQREPAARSVRAIILLDAVAEEQKISVEPEAVDRALSEEAARRRETKEALRAKLTKDGRLKRLEEQLLREKVLDILLTAANT